MIDSASFHAGYMAGYQDGARDVKHQAALLARTPTLISGSQSSRALAEAVQRQHDERRTGLTDAD